MTDVVTYYSVNAREKERWLTFAVLPNGNQWMVRFTGETEAIAKSKAIQFYEAERAKYKHPEAEQTKVDDNSFTTSNPWPAPQGRGHHFAGKAWLIHKVTREKIRVPQEEVSKYLNEYERGGPRSK